MSGEILAVVGMGLALAGFVWRLHVQTDRRLDRIETRLDGRLDRMETRLDALGGDFASIKERLTAVETRLDRIETQLDHLAQDVASGKERLTAVEATLALLIKGLHIEVSGREGADA